MGKSEVKKRDIDKRMELVRVIRDLCYLVREFPILALGNWGYGAEG